ncbi:MAG TPA: hypothetical protein VK869_08400 [Rubrobacteraceae bacterium]|nr:hypothetical protein [Rubrobacteraceae bacterium]
MREPNLELWRQRREELEREAEMNRLGRELRAARRRASLRAGAKGGVLAGRIGKIAAARRFLGEKWTRPRLRSWKRRPSGCAN